MRRWVGNIFAGVLGLLCVGLVVMGARSFWVAEDLRRGRLDPATLIGDARFTYSRAGCLWFRYVGNCPNGQPDPSFRQALWRTMWPDEQWHLYRQRGFGPLGPMWRRMLWPTVSHDRASNVNYSHDWWTVAIPYWIPILLTGAWPIARFGRPILRHRRESRRIRRGQCIGCGYDLRAHNAGDKCPECGRMIAAARA